MRLLHALVVPLFGIAALQDPALLRPAVAFAQGSPGQDTANPDSPHQDIPRRGVSSEPAPARDAGGERKPQTDARKLPGDSATRHALELPGRRLEFTAVAGSVPLYDGEGGPLFAEIAVVAFLKEGAEPRARPVTFLFNGGPGAASGYLNAGAVGPWRVSLADPSPSVPPVPEPNADTWLDFTDLVFVDPVSTGYSWTTLRGDDARKRFFSVEGDASSLAVAIRKWIERNGRRTSPKFLAGESYGGFRAPLVAHDLLKDQGIGVNGLVLLSPVLDFGWRFQDRHSPLRWVSELPSMAATVRDAASGSAAPPELGDVEAYAAGTFLADLLKGARDEAALDRISGAVARYTGLDASLVRRLGGRVDANTFLREKGRGRSAVASSYDATVEGPDPYPFSAFSRPDDPILAGTEPILTGAMAELYRRLGWTVERPYRLLNRDLSGGWQWGNRRNAPQSLDELREGLALDPHMRVLVAHGASDLVTPYFENRLLLAQLPDFGADRLRLALYGGGHMFYTRDASRRAFRDDVERLVLGPAEALR